MTLYAAWNLRRQIVCFRPPPTSPPPPSLSLPTAGMIESYKYNLEVVLWSASVFNDSSKTDGAGRARSSKKKQTWLRRCESNAACQEKISRPSRYVAASFVADRVEAVAAATPLIVAADTSFHSAESDICRLGLFWWRYFILFYREFSLFIVMLHSIENYQILFWILYRIILLPLLMILMFANFAAFICDLFVF